MIPAMHDEIVRVDVIERIWATRRCFVCERLGRCEHREPEIDEAEIIARNRRLMRMTVDSERRRAA